jgi:hypothetical protein
MPPGFECSSATLCSVTIVAPKATHATIGIATPLQMKVGGRILPY